MTDQEKPPTTEFVREQQYELKCAQCERPARGALPDFIENGWIMKDGAQYGQEGVLFFCPACTMGLKPVAKT